MKSLKKIISFSILIVFVAFLFSSESSQPSLCDCLTKSEYAQVGDSKYKQCQEVFNQRYGTRNPSADRMKNDYYSCK